MQFLVFDKQSQNINTAIKISLQSMINSRKSTLITTNRNQGINSKSEYEVQQYSNIPIAQWLNNLGTEHLCAKNSNIKFDSYSVDR